jgi:uncharacterized protein with PIN domain
VSVEEAEQDVREFLELARIQLLPIGAEDAATALVAFSRYEKGRGHSAQLNLGDCFAYAMAKNHRTSILFKGEDSARPTSNTALTDRVSTEQTPVCGRLNSASIINESHPHLSFSPHRV